MFKIDHEDWVEAPFWLAWMIIGSVYAYFGIFIVMFLDLSGLPVSVLALVSILILVLSLIHTVLTRKLHKRWLENRKREADR